MYLRISFVVFSSLRLLDREQVGGEEALLDDEDDDGFLKAFKVFLSFDHVQFCVLKYMVLSVEVYLISSPCLSVVNLLA